MVSLLLDSSGFLGRSTGDIGVRFELLAFNFIIWRSAVVSGVQLDVLAFGHGFWHSI